MEAGALQPFLRQVERRLASESLMSTASLVSSVAYCRTVHAALVDRLRLPTDDLQVKDVLARASRLAELLVEVALARLETHVASSQSAVQSAAQAVKDANARKSEQAQIAGAYSRSVSRLATFLTLGSAHKLVDHFEESVRGTTLSYSSPAHAAAFQEASTTVVRDSQSRQAVLRGPFSAASRC